MQVGQYRVKQKQDHDWQEGEVHWTPKNVVVWPGACTAAGAVAGLFGVGGGIIKVPPALLSALQLACLLCLDLELELGDVARSCCVCCPGRRHQCPQHFQLVGPVLCQSAEPGGMQGPLLLSMGVLPDVSAACSAVRLVAICCLEPAVWCDISVAQTMVFFTSLASSLTYAFLGGVP